MRHLRHRSCQNVHMSAGAEFGAKLRAERERQGKSRADVIREVERLTGEDLHMTTLKRIEDGTQVARVNEAVALAAVLGKRVEDWIQVRSEVEDCAVRLFEEASKIGIDQFKLEKERDRLRAAWESITEQERAGQQSRTFIERVLNMTDSEFMAFPRYVFEQVQESVMEAGYEFVVDAPDAPA